MSHVTESPADLEAALHERFGLERFRTGQREVIEAVLARRDVLCVMPTGGGKSLCYQLPALLLDGLTLVVSPLIALMKDQVDVLVRKGVRATLLNSTLDPAEQRVRLMEIEAGRYDLAYVAPERFRSSRFVEAMARLKPALLAVDEAHCISEWGHDFRPDYARLGRARVAMGMPPCIALTATATDVVRRDIADQLDLREPAQFVTGFDRPNLSYHVVPARRDAEKQAALAQALDAMPGPAIIYASSRKRCEEVARFVEAERRRKVVVYHAGLAREERHEAQDRFMSGHAEVVVATNAFGMGVDKADIRSVIHYNLPGTLEAYYQEAGRAGRDGGSSRCVLLYAPGDRFLQEMFIENEYPPPEVVYKVYEYLRGLDADPIELTQAEIRESARIELAEGAVGTALRLLEGAGAIERFLPRENQAIVRFNNEPDEGSLADRLPPQAHVQKIVLLALEGLARGRYGEPVYFAPDDLSAQLGIERVALTRAIRNLAGDLPIDYVPPFRGNAIRVLDRRTRARDLPIDFGALNQRKRQEYEKLDRMVGYAESRTCRRAVLLGYFGDVNGATCGRCDRCGDRDAGIGGIDAPASIDTDAGKEILLKILSGVARVKGRVGKTLVSQMLTGSLSERMDRLGLKSLSTFGILASSGFRQSEVAQLLEALMFAGLIETQDAGGQGRSKPVVTLSEAGWDWLKARGPSPLTLELPPGLAAKLRYGGLERRPVGEPRADSPATAAEPVASFPAERPAFAEEADPLWGRLKSLRLQWAREAKAPPYTIFPDKVLAALVSGRPTNPAELGAIKGVGPSTLEKYGRTILDAIAGEPASPTEPPAPSVDRDDEPPAPARPVRNETARPPDALAPAPPRPSPTTTATPSGEYVPTEEWTWRLLDRGFTIDEAAAIRGLERAAILRHATWTARQGRPVPLASFLPPDVQWRWESWQREHGDAPPDDADARPGLWPLFLACRARS